MDRDFRGANSRGGSERTHDQAASAVKSRFFAQACDGFDVARHEIGENPVQNPAFGTKTSVVVNEYLSGRAL